MKASPRSLAQRMQDTRRRLDEDVDAWVATADRAGTPYLVPLSFLWDGETLLISTAAGNPTARNLRAGSRGAHDRADPRRGPDRRIRGRRRRDHRRGRRRVRGQDRVRPRRSATTRTSTSCRN
ncbi:pyridoxamine 5'-phosphate oxidase family protein [Streptosporangium lutulentum]